MCPLARLQSLGAAAAGQATDSMRMFLMRLEGGKPGLGEAGFSPNVRGTSRIRHDGALLWEKPFVSGEANMNHAIANLEHHHFRNALFRRPGMANVHFFGTGTLSCADGVVTRPGDLFEIEADAFRLGLRNPLARAESGEAAVRVRSL